MVPKSKTDRAASGETAPPAAQGPPARAREPAGSAYDSFWHCLSGRRPAERWARDRDVAALGSLRAAFGLAEERQPIDYGPMAQADRPSPPAKGEAGEAPSTGARSAGTGENRGGRSPPRRG